MREVSEAWFSEGDTAMKTVSSSRRDFLKAAGGALSATTLLARSASRILGANERVHVGMIGFGIRGSQLVRNVYAEPNTEVVAVADLYDGHLARALELAEDHPKPATTKRYQEILERQDVGAVVVAVPDFWHKRVCLDALAAGKHVYCEKPLLHNIEDAADFIAAVERSGKIFQVGSQHVSSPHVIEARRLIQSGELGKVTQIKTTWDTNTVISAWEMPVPSDASVGTIDWTTYLEQASHKVPFDPARFFSWRQFQDYGEALAGDVLVHMITTVHFVMSVTAAPPVISAAGGRFVWDDGRDVYDAISILSHYPEGFIANYEANQDNQFLGQHIYILGSKASMDLTFGDYKVYAEDWPISWSYAVESWARPEREKFYRAHNLPLTPSRKYSPPGAPKPIKESAPLDYQQYVSGFSPHMASFMAAIREGKQPVEDVHMGVEAATTAILGNRALAAQRTLHWDRRTRTLAEA